MPLIHDLIEVTGFPQYTTLQRSNDDILDVYDNVNWSGSGDVDEGDDLTIAGTTYNIDQIYELDSNMTMVTDQGSLVFSPSSESNLEVMLLQVSNGGTTRYFLLPNDSFGDFANIQSISFGAIGDVAGSDASITASNNDDIMVCLAGDTRITVADGSDVVISALKVGDLVMTADNGPRAIVWICHRKLDPADFETRPHLRPIRLRAGVLGDGLPKSDLLVSPQHRVLVRSEIAKRMFGTNEVLVAAKNLTRIDGVDVAFDVSTVVYYHLLFDRHEVIFANGARAESLYTGPMALKAIDAESRSELLEIFPELADANYRTSTARTLVGGRRGRRLALRHARNHMPLWAPQAGSLPARAHPVLPNQ